MATNLSQINFFFYHKYYFLNHNLIFGKTLHLLEYKNNYYTQNDGISARNVHFCPLTQNW